MNVLPPQPSPAPPHGIVASLDELLRSPHQLVARSQESPGLSPASGSVGRLLLGTVLLTAAYGAAAGLFQGGSQILVAAVKAPVIVLGSLAICLPSLYVFTSLAGAKLSARAFSHAVAGFSGMLGLLLMSLLPICWLFSVGTASLLFVTWIHLAAWGVALFFAYRFLTVAVVEPEMRRPLFLWIVLYAVVSFQLATTLRPVLFRTANGPVLETGKRLFLEQLDELGKPLKPPVAPGK